MSYKANSFFNPLTPEAFVAADEIGGVVAVGAGSAESFRVDVVADAPVNITLETYVGANVWKVVSALDVNGEYSQSTGSVPVGAKLRLKATGNVTVTSASITLSR